MDWLQAETLCFVEFELVQLSEKSFSSEWITLYKLQLYMGSYNL